MIQTIYIDNCSHGYLQVDKADFKKVMGSDAAKVTGYSGVKDGKVFLEEDQDAGLFMDTAKRKGYLVNVDNSYQPNFTCPKNYRLGLIVN